MGYDLKLFSRMGDRVATAILKVLYPGWAVADEGLKKILVALCAAFEHPGNIEEASDRIPAVTNCLLDRLIAGAATDEQGRAIASARQRIAEYVARGRP